MQVPSSSSQGNLTKYLWLDIPVHTSIQARGSAEVSECKNCEEVVSGGHRAPCRTLEATDWNALYEAHGSDIDGLTDCVSEYIKFCTDDSIPTKEVHCYPNNKPRVTSNLKALLSEK